MLALPEVEFARMRRQAMTARRDRRRGGTSAPFVCACCKHPVYLSRYRKEHGNRWFVHDAGAPRDCIFYEGSRHTPEQIRALVYRGQQEGALHRAMKDFLATWLRRDPDCSNVTTEQTTFSAVAKGEWRRPDVKCVYRGVPVVFEVQLSYTFLSEVIARDEFYRREGTHIIWVFQRFDLSRAAVTDEVFFNRRNLFVLDMEAMAQSHSRTLLTFSGYRQEPSIQDRRIVDTWASHFVGLRETTFPQDTFRPYFFDYDQVRAALEKQLREQIREQNRVRWRGLVDRFLQAALAYYDADYDSDLREEALMIVDDLEDSGHWHNGYNVLKERQFLDYHGVLPMLLSIKTHRVVGYRVSTVFQVLEAGVRTSGDYMHRPYTVLLLWAYKLWRPPVKPAQHKWLVTLAHKVKASLDAGEDTYRRFVGFDEVIGLLFPELDEILASPWGTDRQAMADAFDQSDTF